MGLIYRPLRFVPYQEVIVFEKVIEIGSLVPLEFSFEGRLKSEAEIEQVPEQIRILSDCGQALVLSPSDKLLLKDNRLTFCVDATEEPVAGVTQRLEVTLYVDSEIPVQQSVLFELTPIHPPILFERVVEIGPLIPVEITIEGEFQKIVKVVSLPSQAQILAAANKNLPSS